LHIKKRFIVPQTIRRSRDYDPVTFPHTSH